jgi:hypothetical protein
MPCAPSKRSNRPRRLAYRDYAPRVTDAKIQVDQYLAGKPTGPERIAIAKAMDFYVFASSAWNAKVSSSGYETVGASLLINECAALTAHATAADARFPGRNSSDRATTRGISISISGIPVVWTCASDQLAEAEKLLAEKKLPMTAAIYARKSTDQHVAWT